MCRDPYTALDSLTPQAPKARRGANGPLSTPDLVPVVPLFSAPTSSGRPSIAMHLSVLISRMHTRSMRQNADLHKHPHTHTHTHTHTETHRHPHSNHTQTHTTHAGKDQSQDTLTCRETSGHVGRRRPTSQAKLGCKKAWKARRTQMRTRTQRHRRVHLYILYT